MTWNLLTRFRHSNQRFSENSFTPLRFSKFEIFVNAQLAITRYHIIFTNFLTLYRLESYIRVYKSCYECGHRTLDGNNSCIQPFEMSNSTQPLKLKFVCNQFCKWTVYNSLTRVNFFRQSHVIKLIVDY